jgi:hypothetical protein
VKAGSIVNPAVVVEVMYIVLYGAEWRIWFCGSGEGLSLGNYPFGPSALFVALAGSWRVWGVFK